MSKVDLVSGLGQIGIAAVVLLELFAVDHLLNVLKQGPLESIHAAKQTILSAANTAHLNMRRPKRHVRALP